MLNNLKYRFALRIVKLLDTILVSFPAVICWSVCYTDKISYQLPVRRTWMAMILFWFLYISFARLYDAFLISINRIWENIYSQTLAILFSDSILFLLSWLITGYFPSYMAAAKMLIMQILLAVIWCSFAHIWYFRVYPPKKTAIIFDACKGIDQLIAAYGLDRKFKITYILPVEEGLGKISMLHDVDVVFIIGIHSHDRNRILKYCVENHVDVYMIPRIGDVLMSGAKKTHILHLPMLRVSGYDPTPEYVIAKRFFDVLAAGLMLIILSPVMMITALCIKSYDHGSVFYKQTRLTQNGKKFSILKFRSMHMDAEADGISRLASGEDDSRVTPVGRVIRKYHIDELPQLFNVIMGSMSIVGPRPERPEIAAQYEKELPEFRLRLLAKAGLTGYAQVYGEYHTSPYDKLQMDLMYISHPGFWEDLKICFVTVKILFLPCKNVQKIQS